MDIVPSDDCLATNGTNLDFDVDPTQRLGADVDLDETGVDRLVELSEAGYEADGTYACAKNLLA